MKMMGKRVNFAARSVISADPYLRTCEIGIPAFVAWTLTFPEHVNYNNIEAMRELVLNGSEANPGANVVENLTTGTRIFLKSSSK